MTEDAYTQRLSDYLDGEDVSAAERAAMEAHLATCAACRTALAELREVARRAAILPNAPPAGDPWPGIAARIAATPRVVAMSAVRRFSFTLPQLVAAGFALMVLSGGLVFIASYGGQRSALPPMAAGALPPMAEERDPVRRANFADAHYDQAIADLENALENGRNRLDPETIRILETNLHAIDQAIEQSRRALRSDPDNAYLNNHFAEARKRKLALLRRASALAMAPDLAAGS
jgi:tetratricopeptide (TPR) repeat protein